MSDKPKTQCQQGFSAAGVIVVLLGVILIGLGGWYVWRKHHTKNTVPVNSSTQKNSKNTARSQSKVQPKPANTSNQSDPYVGWKMYTSKPGKFTLRYPSGWDISGFHGEEPTLDPDGNETQIRLLHNEDTRNGFGMDIALTSRPNDSADDYPYGDVSTLPNGLSVWTGKQMLQRCPNLQLVTGQNFLAQLNNGASLTLIGSFCWSQKSDPTYNYAQQASSESFRQAKQILSSIQPN